MNDLYFLNFFERLECAPDQRRRGGSPLLAQATHADAISKSDLIWGLVAIQPKWGQRFFDNDVLKIRCEKFIIGVFCFRVMSPIGL